MITSVLYADKFVYRMYAGRAVSEKRIKELKDNSFLDTFFLESLDFTDATFRLSSVAYNLLATFRETVLPRCWVDRRLQAVQDFVFLVAAKVITRGQRFHIRFTVRREERPELLSRLRTLSEG